LQTCRIGFQKAVGWGADAACQEQGGLVDPSKPLAPQTELGSHRWRVLILSSVGMFMGTMLTTILAVALPAEEGGIAPALGLSYSETLWVQAVYPLMMSICLIPVGRLSDRYGLMRFYLMGVGIFGVFSIACALAFDGAFLVAMRCLQAIGGAFMSATAMALVTVSFPPRERGKGLGFNAMAGYVGLTVGPPLGGVVVAHISWRWVFLISLPLVLVTIANGLPLLGAERQDRESSPEPHALRPGNRLDWAGILLLALSMLALLVPLISVPFWGWTNPLTLGLLGGFVLLLAAFVCVELRVRNPLLDLDLVRRNRVFAAGTSAALLNYAAVYGITAFTAAYLEIVEGYSSKRAGLVLLTSPIFIAGLSAFFGRLSDRIGQAIPATGGMLMAAAGTAQLGFLPSPAPLWRVMLALSFVGLGMAAFSSPNTSSVMGSVRRSELSLASGFLGTMRTAGQGLSIGLLGAIAASSLGPVGARVIFLHEKLSGGASAAATSSFSSGYRDAMLVAAGMAVVGALISLVRGPRSE
jgi:MFS family permease